MASTLTQYNVFIASPTGLQEVREAFRTAIADYNETDANHRGVHFTAVGWEETLGGVGRPQSLINEDIRKCDFFILVLHDRWGSPSSCDSDPQFSSGTEEEFIIALECYNNPKNCMQELVLFFRSVDERQLSDPGDQLQKVLAFRKEREHKKDILFHTFDSALKFKGLFQRHLSKWVRDHESRPTKTQTGSLVYIPNNKQQPFLDFPHDTSDQSTSIAQAEQLAEQGKLVEAEIIFSGLVVKCDDPEVLAKYGKFLRKIGQLDRAKKIINDAITKSTQFHRLETKAFATLQLARIEEDQGNVDEATGLFRRAYTEFDLCGDKKGMAKVTRNIGKVLKTRGQLDEAEYELIKATKLYKELGDKAGEASALGYLGVVFKARGKFQEAEKVHRKALKIHEQNNNEKGIAIVWGNLGTVLRLQGKAEEALEYHQKSLEIYRKVHDLQGTSRELSNIGTAYRHMNQLEKSQEYHHEALELSEELGNQHGIAIQQSCLGQVATIMGEYDKAEQYHLKSLFLSEQIGDKQGAAIQYKNLGTIYRLTNDLDKAESAIRKALEIDTNKGFLFGVGKSKSELGKVMVLRQRWQQAKHLFLEALAAYMESGAQTEIAEMEKLIHMIENKKFEELKNSL